MSVKFRHWRRWEYGDTCILARRTDMPRVACAVRIQEEFLSDYLPTRGKAWLRRYLSAVKRLMERELMLAPYQHYVKPGDMIDIQPVQRVHLRAVASVRDV